MTSKHALKLQLIPWDHTSEEQVTRLYEQRVACGWRADEVPSYIESAEKGGRMFFWVVLADSLPDRDSLLQTHTQAYPKEATTVQDTARRVRLLPREPSGKPFIPIGHIALEVHSSEDDAKLGLPSEGVVWIHQLYISYALQRGGFGAGAMDMVETVAAQPPFDGKMLVLDTIDEEMQLSPEGLQTIYKDRGVPVPRVSTQSWYGRRGYEVFLQVKEAYEWNYGTGSIGLNLAYMRKMLK